MRKSELMEETRDIVVYFGIIRFPDKNALCHRANGIGRSVKDLGYSFVQIGVNRDVRRGEYRKVSENVYEIAEPETIKEWLYACVSAKEICLVLNEIGLGRIKTVIMADYRFLPMRRIKKFCEKMGINFSIDVMDWFEGGTSFKSKIKAMDNFLRMKYLYPKVERRIYICSLYETKIGKTDRTVVVPGTIVTIESKNDNHEKLFDFESERKILFFAGRPGNRCEKEKIDWVIKCIYDLKNENEFEFLVAGVTEEEYRLNNPEKVHDITKNIHFLGDLSHRRCIELLSTADFSLVIREKKALADYGFSTKIGEAFSCGIPVIATDTSDNSNYIFNGVNGYICDCSYEALYKLLQRVNVLDREEINRIKRETKQRNPLLYSNYTELLEKVIE